MNRWAVKHYKSLTEHTILAILNELEANIAGIKKQHILTSPNDAYALASRFKNVVYKYRFFKTKPQRILRSIIDRCGEAYYKKDLTTLYIPKKVIKEWSLVFRIPLEKIYDYLAPFLRFKILRPSDRPRYVYKIDMNFFQLVGPVAQYLVTPIDTRRFAEMMAVTSGITSIYVIATAVKSRKFAKSKPLIPWFLKLPMIYTLSGLEIGGTRIRDILELSRVNAVDSYFVIERGVPVELWRSIRTEAFEFMSDNYIIEQAIPNGYKLNKLWVLVHEEGIQRYIKRLRERYERRYRSS